MFEVVAIGSINSIHVRPMEVFRTAFPVNAQGAVVLHNHPSGDPTPSEADNAFTSKLNRLAQDMGLQFIDHIIIGKDSYYSFKERTNLITTEL
jgi:DNA repair protein RadC